MRTAWATREPERAAPFLAALAPLGLAGLAAPLTAVVPVADLAPLDAALAALRPGEVVALASARASELVASRLAGRTAALGPARWWAVGESSAAPLRRLGLTVAVAPRASAVGLAEAILAAEAPASLRVLLPRAEDGREEAASALRAAGASVEELVIYRSARLSLQTPALQEALAQLHRGQVAVVALFAPSQVSALVAALASSGHSLATAPALFAAIGETTARALAAAGAGGRFVVASAPTPEAMANAVAARYSP